MKRVLSIVLTLALLLTALPLALGVSAADEQGYYLTATTSSNIKYYYSGSASSGKGGVTPNVESAAILYKEVESGKTYFYYMNGSTKTYICLTNDSKGFKPSTSKTTDCALTEVTINDSDFANPIITFQPSNLRVPILYNNGADIRTYKSTDTTNIKAANVPMVFEPITTGGTDTSCEHENTYFESIDDATHKNVCDDCGATVSVSNHNLTEISKTEATCQDVGSTTSQCADCDKIIVSESPKTSHSYVNGKCSVCGNSDVVFQLGENGTAHNDGNEISEYSETVNGYTLTLTDLSKVYNTNTYDAKGNSCLKLGTSSAIGTFTFTVPNDVESVIIMAAKYKSYEKATVSVNGTSYELTNKSDSGEYDEIKVDTKTTKTVVFATTTDNDKRAMVNTIIFCLKEQEECTHTNTSDANVVEPTYFKDGSKDIVCAECETVIDEDVVIPAAEAALKGDFTTAFADGKLTISWKYSDALLLDIAAGAKISFNYSIAGYSNTVKIASEQGADGASVTLEGFNAERLNGDFTFNLSADVDTANKLSAATATTVKASAIATDDKLTALLEALNSVEKAEVSGQVANTEWLVSNTAKLDIKAGTAQLRIVASQKLIDHLTKYGKENRGVKLIVKVGDITKTFTLEALYKVTLINVSGLSFDYLNGNMSAQLVIDYPETDKDVTTAEITFNCGEIIANADTDVANAFAAYMN